MIGSRLKELRKMKGMTLKILAHKAGLSISMVSQMESGDKKLIPDSLISVLDALGISVEDFFSNYSPEDIVVMSQAGRILKSNNQHLRAYLTSSLQSLIYILENDDNKPNEIQQMELLTHCLIEKLNRISKQKSKKS